MSPYLRKAVPIVALFLSIAGASPAAPPGPPPIPVYFRGLDAEIRKRVFLDDQLVAVDTVDNATVIVIHNALPPGSERDQIISQVREGKGLVILMGPEVNSAFLTQLCGGTVELVQRTQDINVSFYQTPPNFSRELWDRLRGRRTLIQPHWSQERGIDWSSIPQVYDRFAPVKAMKAWKTLVLDQDSNEGVLYEGRAGKGTVYLLTAWLSVDPEASLSRKENKNYHLLVWPFFNYLLYGMIVEAAGQAPPKFADWPGSPMLRTRERLIIGAAVGALSVAVFMIFLLVFKWSRRHRTPLQGFATAVWTLDTFNLEASRGDNHWKDAGFYRPLSGFIVKVPLVLIQTCIFIPLGFWIANNLEIFPQVRGIEKITAAVLGVLFYLFDLGTGPAAIKFYAEYRVKDPGRAVQYFQFLTWWQILTGLVQVVIVTLAAFYFFPHTLWAYMSIIFLVRVIMQLFDFVGQFFANIFTSFQRFDYHQYTVFIGMLLWLFAYIGMTVWWREWGARQPRFGEVYGYFFSGISSAVIVPWIGFAISFGFYRKLGYPFKVMFMAHFDWSVIKDVLNFGYKITIREMIDKLDELVSVLIMTLVLTNYLEVSGIFGVAVMVMGNFMILDAIHEAIMPSLSEAHTQGRLALARHYIIQSLNWGLLGGVIIADISAAFAGPLLKMLDPQWERAAGILPIIFLASIFQFFAKMPDSIFKATGQTHYIPLIGGVLLVIKAVLLLVAAPALQLKGLALTLLAVNICDVVISWYLVNRYVLPLCINVPRLALPSVITGVIYLGILLALRALVPPGVPGLVILAVIAFFSFGPVLALAAVFGGWDDLTMDEFERALYVNAYIARLFKVNIRMIQWGRRHRILPVYQPEDPVAVQAESDQIVVARIPEELRQTATLTLTTMGSWKKSEVTDINATK